MNYLAQLTLGAIGDAFLQLGSVNDALKTMKGHTTEKKMS